MLKTDVVVIGAGAVGCAVARELSKYEVNVIVVEKNEDVGGCASKSNSAIIHTGYDAAPGTLESQLVVAANPMYEKLCEELEVPFAKIGAILPTAGCAVITRRDDNIIFDDNRAETLTQAGASLRDGLGNIQVIIFF
jgi:glycine/D-amino acid oxidase-like deaminating enzyme